MRFSHDRQPPRFPVATIGPRNAAQLCQLVDRLCPGDRQTFTGVVARSARTATSEYPKIALPLRSTQPPMAA